MTNKDYLTNLLNLCTEKQIEMFHKMYPNYPNSKQMQRAINQVEKTLLDVNRENDDLRNLIQESVDKLTVANKVLLDADLRLKEADEANKVALEHIKRLSTSENLANAEIQERLAKLDALEAGGVDNWEGYDFAMESLE